MNVKNISKLINQYQRAFHNGEREMTYQRHIAHDLQVPTVNGMKMVREVQKTLGIEEPVGVWLEEVAAVKSWIEWMAMPIHPLIGKDLEMSCTISASFLEDVPHTLFAGSVNDVFSGNSVVKQHVWIVVDGVLIVDYAIDKKINESGIPCGVFPVWAADRIEYVPKLIGTHQTLTREAVDSMFLQEHSSLMVQ